MSQQAAWRSPECNSSQRAHDLLRRLARQACLSCQCQRASRGARQIRQLAADEPVACAEHQHRGVRATERSERPRITCQPRADAACKLMPGRVCRGGGLFGKVGGVGVLVGSEAFQT